MRAHLVRSSLAAFVFVLFLGASSARAAVGLRGDRRTTLFIKGGAGRFVGGTLAGETVWAPAYGGGLAFQPADFFGIDFIYEGARVELAGPVTDGTGEHAALWKHGGTVLLKFGGAITPVIYPWLGAGVGATWLVPSGPFFAGGPTDLMLEVPVTAGIDLRSENFLAGLRVSYRFLIDEWFARDPSERLDSGGMFDVQLVLGVRF